MDLARLSHRQQDPWHHRGPSRQSARAVAAARVSVERIREGTYPFGADDRRQSKIRSWIPWPATKQPRIHRKGQSVGLITVTHEQGDVAHWRPHDSTARDQTTSDGGMASAAASYGQVHILCTKPMLEKVKSSCVKLSLKQVAQGKPAHIFIDELDAICPRRNDRQEHQSHIVGQLLTLMDGKKKSSKTFVTSTNIVAVASTNRVDAIDPALRSPGRFDSDVEVTVPTVEERLQILKLYAKKLHLDESVDLQTIAASCNGYVGADLEALCQEAA